MTTAETIARRRAELGLTQAELAQRVGIDPRNIRRYEAGEATPTLGMAQGIAHALGISLDELAGGTPTFGGLWWSSWDGLASHVIRGVVHFAHHGRSVDVNPAALKDPAFIAEDLQWRSSLLADGDDLLGWFDLRSTDVTARGTLQLRRQDDTITGTWVKISLRDGMTTGKVGLGRTPDAANNALAIVVSANEKRDGS